MRPRESKALEREPTGELVAMETTMFLVSSAPGTQHRPWIEFYRGYQPRPSRQRPPLLAKTCGRLVRIPQRALVVALACLVHLLPAMIPGALAQNPGSAPASRLGIESNAPPSKTVDRTPFDDLPLAVQEMRDAILNAVVRGEIEELRGPIEWNELRPEFGIPKETDAIAHWTKSSRDGHGREILAILANILAAPPAKLPIGPDLENNDVFVWPYLSEIPPKNLTPSQHVELLRIAPAEEVEAMISRGKWTWYRLAIAADGTWHIFSKSDQSNLKKQ